MKTIKDTTIFYINRKKDKERQKELLLNLKKLGLEKNAIRVEAIEGKKLKEKKYRKSISKVLGVQEEKLKPEFWHSRKNFRTLTRDIDVILPRIGCYLSHLRASLMAKQKNLDSVLILEDDAIILPNILNSFNVPKDADVIYLGGTFAFEKETEKKKGKMIKIDNSVLKLYGMFGYYIPSIEKINDVYNVLKAVFLDGGAKLKHDDWRSGNVRLMGQNNDRLFVNFFQRYGNCYFLNPVSIYHKMEEDVSTLGNKKYSKRYGHKFYYDSAHFPYINRQLKKLLHL